MCALSGLKPQHCVFIPTCAHVTSGVWLMPAASGKRPAASGQQEEEEEEEKEEEEEEEWMEERGG